MRNVILSPHYDDAVFSCFSQINSPKTLVINIFTGIPKKNTYTLWDSVCGHPNSKVMMKLRKAENEKVLNKLECTYIDLDYLDNQYQKNKDEEEILNKLLTILKKDDQIYAPMAESKIYKHPDHLLTRRVSEELKNLGFDVYLYADLPYMKAKSSNESIRLNKDQLKEKIHFSKEYKTQYSFTNITSLGRLSRAIKSGLENIVKY
jgi:GlcNAc-PI de-N-acetylase